MSAYETLALDFDGLTEGRALRDEGMARTEAADVDNDKAVIDAAIRSLCDYSGYSTPWSANDLRSMLPSVRQPLIGARIRAARGRGEIRCVGYTPSDLPSTHAHDIKQWIAASP